MNVKNNNIGDWVFDDEKICKYAGTDVYLALKKARKTSENVDSDTLKRIIKALCKWAESNGVKYYTHWFQPMGRTVAEKLSPLKTNNLEKSIKSLVMGESDASSFPSGGLRTTFEARGISRWDYSTPAFIKNVGDKKVLYIPTLFFSPSDDALDKKTPLLRSIISLNSSVSKLLNLVDGVKNFDIVNNIGIEQEFFLIKKDLYEKRLDLKILSRTLFGIEDKNLQYHRGHYSSTISGKAGMFFSSLNELLDKFGILPCAEHLEASPNQFEVALSYTDALRSTDQNQILMDCINEVATNLNLKACFDEKPFSNINGSGKHTNWSISNNDENLFTPGKNGENTLRFLLFITIFIKAIDEYSSLILSSIITRTNEFRLGSNEAPPRVLSLFIGDELQEILEKSEDELKKIKIKGNILIGDRNRTSPIAFTGNKFEFRAVGASQSVSSPVCFINSAFSCCAKQAIKLMEENSSLSKEERIVKTIKQFWNEHKKIIFNGNCYSDEWREEIKNRNLIESTNTISTLDQIYNNKNTTLLKSENVMNENEFLSRINVYKENYINSVELEASIVKQMLYKNILPSIKKEINTNSLVTDFDSKYKTLIKMAEDLDKLMDENNTEKIKIKLEEIKMIANDTLKYISKDNMPFADYDELLLGI